MQAVIDLEPLGALYNPVRYPDVKDPCPVYDGRRWHLFGTGCGRPDGLEILHCTAPSLDGPWTELEPSRIVGTDAIRHPAAPGVIAEGRKLHMFMQHDFNILGGALEHLVSEDGGRTFVHADTSLASLPGTVEAGVYDPDPAAIDGQRYLVYSGMSVIGQPDLFLARSTSGSWAGPWERLGCILCHTDVDFHNQIDDDDYEWGLEGPQLTELPDGSVLLTAVCFLAGAPAGHRQRLLLAVADAPEGPYELLGPIVEPAGGMGENGHGTAVIDGHELRVVYQERAGDGSPWHFRSAVADVSTLAVELRQAS
jgi:hypothetical protein